MEKIRKGDLVHIVLKNKMGEFFVRVICVGATKCVLDEDGCRDWTFERLSVSDKSDFIISGTVYAHKDLVCGTPFRNGKAVLNNRVDLIISSRTFEVAQRRPNLTGLTWFYVKSYRKVPMEELPLFMAWPYYSKRILNRLRG